MRIDTKAPFVALVFRRLCRRLDRRARLIPHRSTLPRRFGDLGHGDDCHRLWHSRSRPPTFPSPRTRCQLLGRTRRRKKEQICTIRHDGCHRRRHVCTYDTRRHRTLNERHGRRRRRGWQFAQHQRLVSSIARRRLPQPHARAENRHA